MTQEQTTTSRALVHELLRPDIYPDQPKQVRLVETHISWVFLTPQYAYKLKKPVQFEFLDFSTPAARHRACRQEVALNRRFAPDVYLNVVPITSDRVGALSLGGTGEPVDWLVKMRCLPRDRALDWLIQRGTLRPREIDKLALKLAEFYTDAAPLTMLPEHFSRNIGRHIRANRDELGKISHGMPPYVVKRVHGAHLQFVTLSSDVLENRVCDGRIVEGHGDLRPEHVYMEHNPVIIDCIEFSRELRCLDAVDELCFLAMECQRLGGQGVGQQVLDRYCEQSGDAPSECLLAFYKSYRACVRAKVVALRAQQLASSGRRECREMVDQYLSLADQHARRLGPPLVVVLRGLMGSGKTTLARALAECLGAELLGTDLVRREILSPRSSQDAYGAGLYDETMRRRVYVEMITRAQRLLRDGLSVILDGTFLTNQLRQRAMSLAEGGSALPLVVHCRCPDDVARARIAERLVWGEGVSDARPDLYELQKRDEEPDEPGVESITIDTTIGLAGQLEAVLASLAKRRSIC